LLATEPERLQAGCTAEEFCRAPREGRAGTGLTLRAKNALLYAVLPMSSSKSTLDDLRIERDQKPESHPRFWPVIALVVLALVAAVVWWLMRPKTVEVPTVLVNPPAAIPAAERTVLNASGYVTARRAA